MALMRYRHKSSLRAELSLLNLRRVVALSSNQLASRVRILRGLSARENRVVAKFLGFRFCLV